MDPQLDPDDPRFVAQIRVLRIIHGALAAGVVAITMVGLAVAPARPAGDWWEPGKLVTAIMLTIGIMTLAARGPLGHFQAQLALRFVDKPPAPGEPPTGGLLGVYVASRIVMAALAESAGFMGAVAYLVEGLPVALALPLYAVAVLLATTPTVGRAREWIEAHRRGVEGAPPWPA